MKKIILYVFLFLSAVVFKSAEAQVSVRINIGSQPLWGPTGYDYVDYYYLPDIEMYYHVPTRKYFYLSNKRWISSRSLPARYRNFDLNSGYKVVVNEPRAYNHFNTHKAQYATYRGNRSQGNIRSSNDSRYHGIKGHPQYKKSNRKNDRRH